MDEEIKSQSSAGDSLPRRMRLSIEGAWKEACQLAETVLDTLVVPPGGFSALAFGWLTSLLFFALSVAVVGVIGLGGLVLFVGLECLALLAYAYPGALFLISVAGGIAPPLVVYWLLHAVLGVQGDWTAWGAYPLVLVGLFGSYHYWRFGRVIANTGQGALDFYRGAAPRAREIFGAPVAIFAGVLEVLKVVLGVLRGVARESSSWIARGVEAYRERGGAGDGSGGEAEASTGEAEGKGGE